MGTFLLTAQGDIIKNAISNAREELSKRYDGRLSAADADIGQRRQKFESEVAGKGLSGRYGMGPAAQVMLADLANREEQRRAVGVEKAETLRKFDSLAQDWVANRGQLSGLYNISLPQASIEQNGKIMLETKNLPEYLATELAVKVFLAMIFCGLFLLKLFEPSSIRLYLSEVLQQEFDRYLAGTFDPMLPSTERSTTVGITMPPQRFYEFLIRVWVPANALPQSVAAARSLTLLEQLRVQIDAEVEQTKAQVSSVCSAADEAHRSLTELRSAMATVASDRRVIESKVATFEAQQGNLDEQGRVEYLSLLRTRLLKADQTLNDLQEALPTETEKCRRANAALTEAENKLREREGELLQTQRKIQEVRSLLANAVGVAAESALGTHA